MLAVRQLDRSRPAMTPRRNSALPNLLPHLAPDSGEAQIVRIYENLDATQWWSPEDLRQQQMLQLARLIGHARSHVPFYAERLDGLQAGAKAGVGRRTPGAFFLGNLRQAASIVGGGSRCKVCHRLFTKMHTDHRAETIDGEGFPARF